MKTIEELTAEIVDWADGVFPDRDPSSALLKLFEEVGELVRDPKSPGEYADICIMLFDLANMHGVDLTAAIQEKMEINRKRQWSVTTTGTLQHIPNMPMVDTQTVEPQPSALSTGLKLGLFINISLLVGIVIWMAYK